MMVRIIERRGATTDEITKDILELLRKRGFFTYIDLAEFPFDEEAKLYDDIWDIIAEKR